MPLVPEQSFRWRKYVLCAGAQKAKSAASNKGTKRVVRGIESTPFEDKQHYAVVRIDGDVEISSF